GTDVFLNLVDRRFDPYLPPETTLVVRTTCTNRDLPVELRRAGERLLFDLETAAPLPAVRCLRMPTLPLRPPVRRGAFWRLVSPVNLNYLSPADSPEGRHALQARLRLYDYTSGEGGSAVSAVTNQLVEGITAVSSRRVTGRVAADAGADAGFCRGVEVMIELDEQRYIGVGSFLFASVMERF